MGTSGYSHSPYFRAKQAAKCAFALSQGRRVQAARVQEVLSARKQGAARTEGVKQEGLSTRKQEAARNEGTAREQEVAQQKTLSARELKAARKRLERIGRVELRRTKELLDVRNAYRRSDSCSMKDFAGGFVFGYNVPVLGLAIAADIGEAMIRDVRAIADPAVREALKSELKRNLRIVRRPWYYARETARRRQLAAERRKLHRRTTANPCPTAEALLAAWKVRKTSKEAMILLGGMLHDLECYVDNTLRFDADGNVVGRNGGIRGWLKENLPELAPKYKTLMRYKAMAIRLRQATRTQDPLPTDEILKEPRTEVAREILAAEGNTFEALGRAIERLIEADWVLRDPVRKKRRRIRRRGACKSL